MSGAHQAAGAAAGRPAITRTRLYSYLVTRPTGRAVRLGIEGRLAADDRRHVLTVLDFTEVPLIDFSCADEVVVKLVLNRRADARRRRWFLFRGVGEHHVEPIQSALDRQRLAVAAETTAGEPLLLGSATPPSARAWEALWRLGRARADGVAEALGAEASDARAWLDELEARGLLLREAATYVSFRLVLADAAEEGGGEGRAPPPSARPR